MERCLVCLIGPVLAALFAIAMYAIYGDINWGSPAFKAHSWIEPVFWILAASGVAALLLRDTCKGIGGYCGRFRRHPHPDKPSTTTSR